MESNWNPIGLLFDPPYRSCEEEPGHHLHRCGDVAASATDLAGASMPAQPLTKPAIGQKYGTVSYGNMACPLTCTVQRFDTLGSLISQELRMALDIKTHWYGKNAAFKKGDAP